MREIQNNGAKQEMPKRNVEELIKEYTPALQAFIRKRIPNSEDAEDILQDVFYQLIKNINNTLNPIEHISGWLYKVARNFIINKKIKKHEDRMPTYYSEDGEENIISEFTEIALEGQKYSMPDMEYLRSLIWEALNNALAKLPMEQRQIFELTEFDGIPLKEISQATGVSVNTLLSRKHYAVIYLRKQLKMLYKDLINN